MGQNTVFVSVINLISSNSCFEMDFLSVLSVDRDTFVIRGGVARARGGGGVVGSDNEETEETVKGPEPVSEPEPSKEAKELFTDRLERQRRRLIRCQGGEERWEALPPTTWRRLRPSF